MNKTKLFTLIFLLMTNNAIAKQSVETTPWGYSGIINVPNSDILDKGKFYINTAYTFRNPSLLASFQMGLLDNLELGILGGFPFDIYSGLAGNIKYRFLKQDNNIPLSFATGINVLGIKKVGNNNFFFNSGNSIYMVASYDLNIKFSDYLYNILSAHLGFSGNLEGANILAGIDIPVTKYINLGVEYTGKSSVANEMLNFGIKIKPIEELSINFFTLGTNFTEGFKNTEYMLGLSYNSNLFFSNKKEEIVKEIPKISREEEKKEELKENNTIQKEKVEESKKIPKIIKEDKNELPLIQEGNLKINILDENTNLPISDIKTTIRNKDGNIIDKFSINNGVHNINKLKFGEYKIIFDKENYETVINTIKINSPSENIKVKMKKNFSSIFAKVFSNNSSPYPNLDIILNDKTKTKTDRDGNFVFENISAGKYIIKIMKNNTLLKKIDIDIIKGIDLKREIYLDEIKEVKKVEVKENKTSNINDKEIKNNNKIKDEEKKSNSLVVGKITSDGKILSSARVMLEGDKVTIMTITNKEGLYLIKNIPAGEYKITASKQGFIDKSSKINLNESKQYKYDIILKKKN